MQVYKKKFKGWLEEKRIKHKFSNDIFMMWKEQTNQLLR